MLMPILFDWNLCMLLKADVLEHELASMLVAVELYDRPILNWPALLI